MLSQLPRCPSCGFGLQRKISLLDLVHVSFKLRNGRHRRHRLLSSVWLEDPQPRCAKSACVAVPSARAFSASRFWGRGSIQRQARPSVMNSSSIRQVPVAVRPIIFAAAPRPPRPEWLGADRLSKLGRRVSAARSEDRHAAPNLDVPRE
jgi:hypothetical protein